MFKQGLKTMGILGVIVCILYSSFLFAQGPDTLWTKTYGGVDIDRGYSVQQTTDGGYIITGNTKSFGAGGYDVWLLKTDANGDTLWTKTYGGTGHDYGESVQQTTDNGYIIAGYTNSFGAGNYDVKLIKTLMNGDTLWTKTYGGLDTDYGYSVQQTTDNGYIIAGYTKSFGAGGYDVYLIKTDMIGNTLWTKTYGGVDDERAWLVQQTTDNGYIIAGETESFGVGREDAWLIKTDMNGDTLWTKVYGGTTYDYAKSVQQTTDNGYIVVGETKSFGAGGYDLWLLKTDANGDTLWAKLYGGPMDEYGLSVQETTDNGYIITGWTKSFGAGGADLWLLRIPPTPLFLVTPTSIDFGIVYVDSLKMDSVTVTNIGTATLDIISAESDNVEFTVISVVGSLEPGESMVFHILFTPTDPGDETGNIIFTHNAPSSPDTVIVTGNGISGEALILSITDVPDDQGRWVRITWAASFLDQPGSVYPITQYGVWRRIDENDKGYSSNQERNSLVITGIEDVLEGWDAVGTVPAIQDSIYNFVSPTLVDSNASGINYSVFIITAHTQDPTLYYISDPDSGYSVDNIPPETPYNLAGEVINSDVLLNWQIQLSYPDFSHFAVYRDTASGFVPGDANQIGTSEVSTYTDSSLAVGTYYYVVSAFDVNGNESDYSNEIEVMITGIQETGAGVPTVYALSQNYPNPFKTKTGIHYQLPQPNVVTIVIYNVSGQRIRTLVNEHKGAGFYTVHWNGQSQNGQRVSSGVYFCRMIAGEYTSVKKILLTR
ncbi:hypothetical protein ES705_22279 [subsurface metagenome]